MSENSQHGQETQFLYNQYDAVRQIEESQTKKYEDFKARLKAFEGVKTLDEARELASKILPVANEISHFNVGLAKCTIINRQDMLRISLDSDKEFVSYNFE